jgi:hypothetical protein
LDVPVWAVVVVGVVGFIAATIGFGTFQISRWPFKPDGPTTYTPPTIAERIDSLVLKLSTASSAASDIEKEIQDRQRFVEELRRKEEKYAHLAGLNEAQAQAVAEELESRAQISNKRAFRLNTIMSAAFFLLGIAAAIVIQHL